MTNFDFPLFRWAIVALALAISSVSQAAPTPSLQALVGSYRIAQQTPGPIPAWGAPSPLEAEFGAIAEVSLPGAEEAVLFLMGGSRTGFLMPQFYLFRDAKGRLWSARYQREEGGPGRALRRRVHELDDGTLSLRVRNDIRVELRLPAVGGPTVERFEMQRSVPRSCIAQQFERDGTSRCLAFTGWGAPVSYAWERHERR